MCTVAVVESSPTTPWTLFAWVALPSLNIISMSLLPETSTSLSLEKAILWKIALTAEPVAFALNVSASLPLILLSVIMAILFVVEPS